MLKIKNIDYKILDKPVVIDILRLLSNIYDSNVYDLKILNLHFLKDNETPFFLKRFNLFQTTLKNEINKILDEREDLKHFYYFRK